MKPQFYLFIALLIILRFPAETETSEHQRVGIEQEAFIILSPNISLTIFDSSDEKKQTMTVIETPSIELSINNKWLAFISLPFYQNLSMEITTPPKNSAAFGDPCIGFGYYFKLGDWKLSANASWQLPFGIWNSYEVTTKHITTGSGYHRFSTSLSGTQFFDPVALTIGGEVITTLPRKEQYGYSRNPLVFFIPASITYAANSKLAFSAALKPSLTWPTELNSTPTSTNIKKSLYGNVSLTRSSEKNAFGIQLGKDLSTYKSLPSLTLYYAQTISIKEKK